MKLSRALLAVAVSSTLMLAACGQQTDERTEGVAEETAAAVSTDAPTDEGAAADQPATQEAPTELPAFVSMDCTTLTASAADAPPADAVGVEGAFASFAASGSPSLTIATGSAPATALGIADIKEGDGAEAQPGDTVTVNYCGAGYGGLAVFDSSWSRGEPIAFPLGNLIPGWQEGIPGMKVGGQRLLVIPGALGYGESGAPGIAPNETLVFVIELLDTTA